MAAGRSLPCPLASPGGLCCPRLGSPPAAPSPAHTHHPHHHAHTLTLLHTRAQLCLPTLPGRRAARALPWPGCSTTCGTATCWLPTLTHATGCWEVGGRDGVRAVDMAKGGRGGKGMSWGLACLVDRAPRVHEGLGADGPRGAGLGQDRGVGRLRLLFLQVKAAARLAGTPPPPGNKLGEE